MKRFVLLLAAGMLALLGSGCSFGGAGDETKPLQARLVVLSSNKSYFNHLFGTYLTAEFPGVTLEIVERDAKYTVVEQAASSQADLVWLPMPEFKELAAGNGLQNLEEYAADPAFASADLNPAVLAQIRSSAGGGLFGLTPVYEAKALYYNKTLFERHGVELPQDRMTWPDVIRLANRFPTGGDDSSRIYGLALQPFGGFGEALEDMGRAEGYTLVNPASLKLTVDTAFWRERMQMLADAMRMGSLFAGRPGFADDFIRSQHFLAGRAAMTLASLSLPGLLDAASAVMPDNGRFEWGAVTPPVGEQAREVSRYVTVTDVMGISRQSPNREAAWEILNYVHGPLFARLLGSSNYLLTRDPGDEAPAWQDAFARLPGDSTPFTGMGAAPPAFRTAFDQLVEGQLQALLGEQTTVDQAITVLQFEGQRMLDDAAAAAAGQ